MALWYPGVAFALDELLKCFQHLLVVGFVDVPFPTRKGFESGHTLRRRHAVPPLLATISHPASEVGVFIFEGFEMDLWYPGVAFAFDELLKRTVEPPPEGGCGAVDDGELESFEVVDPDDVEMGGFAEVLLVDGSNGGEAA